MRSITSRQNPVVRTYRDLADAPDPHGRRLLLDGAHLVGDAVRAGLTFELAAIEQARLDVPDSEEARLARELAARGCEPVAVTSAVLAAMSPVRHPSGIVAIARRVPITLDSIVLRDDALIVVLVDVQDPGNVGAILRVAEAAGASGAVVCGTSAHPFSWKALRGAMGSSLRLPVAHTGDTGAVLTRLHASRIRIAATVARGGEAPDAADWRRPVALLVGGEGPGLGDEVVRRCDLQVTIPMTPPVESLNVAVAAAVVLYAARRSAPVTHGHLPAGEERTT